LKRLLFYNRKRKRRAMTGLEVAEVERKRCFAATPVR
jgi:hypothetical protein